MTDQVTRLQALSGGPFTANNNRMDFDIPEDGVYDLSQSWFNLYINVDTTETAGKTGVHNIIMDRLVDNLGSDMERSLFNASLVENASLKSSKYPNLREDIREVACLRQTLVDYMESTSEKDGRRFLSLRQPADRTQYQMSPLRELHKIGNVTSRNVRAAYPIPLSDLFELGTLQEYHATKWGKLRAHLEVFINRLSAYEGESFQTQADQQTMQDATSLGPVTDFVTTAVYDRLEDSPFWVGQKVACSGVGLGGATDFVNVDRLITSIDWNADKTLTLTMDEGSGNVGAGESYNVITVVPTVAASLSITVPQAEIVLQRVRNPGPPPDRLDFRTFTTEQFTGNGETNFQRMFQCEPNAVNLFMMFPVNRTISRNIALESYRIRVNGKDLTDRDVRVNQPAGQDRQLDPLHYDRLSMTFLNADMPLKNYNQLNLNIAPGAQTLSQQTDAATDNTTLVAVPLPLTAGDKNVQVNFTLGLAGLDRLNLYKQVLVSVV